MTETLPNGYSYESTQRELSNEYPHDRVRIVFKDLCALVLWTKVAPASAGLTLCGGASCLRGLVAMVCISLVFFFFMDDVGRV